MKLVFKDLKNDCKKAGFSVYALAKKIGVKPETAGRWAKRTHEPKEHHLLQACDLIGLDVQEACFHTFDNFSIAHNLTNIDYET